MTYNKIIPVILILTILPVASLADPCLATLGQVNPSGAAALASQKAQAEQKAKEELDWGTGKTVKDGQNEREDDRQINGQASVNSATIAAQYASAAAAAFGAGAAIAFAKLMIPQGTFLTTCSGQQGGQSGADSVNANKNEKDVVLAVQNEKDNTNSGISGIDPNVVQVNQ